MTIRKSAEDYLEAMLMLRNEHGYIRSVDIAKKLGVTKPSVSYAVKQLREENYVKADENGMLFLLPAGEEIAQRIYERHLVLTDLFIRMGVDPAIAREDACLVEHDLSIETFEAIKKFAAGQTKLK